MIILNIITDNIQVVLGGAITTNQLHCVTSWRDITTTGYTPGRTVAFTNNITDVNIVSAPAASTQRVVDLISVYNYDTVSQTVSIKFDANGTEYFLFVGILSSGEKIEYVDGTGWTYYSSTGAVKAQQTAAGSTTQIQFNNSGILSGDADFTWDASSNTLSQLGVNTNQVLTKVTASPAAPIAGRLTQFVRQIAGQQHPMALSSLGQEYPLQRALWYGHLTGWNCGTGAAAGTYINNAGANLGTAAAVTCTNTNLYTMMRRSTFGTLITTQNQQVGIRTEANYFRGNAAGLGGFFMVCRMGFTSIKAGCRVFIGFTSGTTAVVTVDPSSLGNMLGFGVDLADTAFTFMHNDASGTCTKETISGQGVLATNNTGYDFYIYCAPNDTTVYYMMVRTDTGAVLVDSSVSADLPVNTTSLTCQCIMSNGTANVAANDAVIGVNQLSIYTER